MKAFDLARCSATILGAIAVAASFVVACGSESRDGWASDASATDPHASTDGGEGGASLDGLDGAVTDDGGSSRADGGDAGDSGAGPVPCGGVVCAPGQTCVSNGVCEYTGCVGINVPGDYGDLRDAVSAALQKGGGTICVGQYVHPFGDANVLNVIAHNGGAGVPLRIFGISPAKSRLTAPTYLMGDVEVHGVRFEAITEVSPLPRVAVEGCEFTAPLRVTARGGYKGKVEVRHTQFRGKATATGLISIEKIWPTEILFDGIDAQAAGAGTTRGNIFVVSTPGPSQADLPVPPGNTTLTIQNSYLHDSALAVAVGASVVHRLVNDTIRGNEIGLYHQSNGPAGIRVNNLFVENGTGISTGSSISIVDEVHHELLFGNTNNFGGGALEGTSTIKADPKLDTTKTPPALGLASPARGAADPLKLPPRDFYGKIRTSLDLGAVEAP